ncbi:MAG: hypothetical protein ACLQBD_26780 [Syntrophobacteraceae bacterium]
MATPTRLVQGVDGNGYPLVAGIPQSNTINAMDFTGAGTKSQNVPAGANFVLISASQNVDVFVLMNGAAAVPSGDVTNGSASEANPPLRQLYGVTTIGVAVNAACIVTLAYYS